MSCDPAGHCCAVFAYWAHVSRPTQFHNVAAEDVFICLTALTGDAALYVLCRACRVRPMLCIIATATPCIADTLRWHPETPTASQVTRTSSGRPRKLALSH